MPGASYLITIIYWFKQADWGSFALRWEKFTGELRSNGMEKTIGAGVRFGTIVWIAALNRMATFGPA
jgi:hypothetical protein